MKYVLKHLIQPVLLITYMTIAVNFYGRVHPFKLLLFLISVNLVILWWLERIIPYKKNWRMDKKGFIENLNYFVLGAISDNVGKFIAIFSAMRLTSEKIDLPLYYSVPFAVIILEFFGYWIHRSTHKGGFLWKVHSIHHTPNKIYAWNNNKIHPLNIILLKFGRLSPLLLLGFNAETIFLASTFGLLQNYISHVNADLKGGRLSYFISTPELHRLHHSTNIEEAQNYSAVIPYWDMLFGTFIYKVDVKNIGVNNTSQYPSKIVDELLFPFMRAKITSHSSS